MWKFIVGIARKLTPGIAAAMPILLFSTFILLNVAIWWAGPWLEIAGNKPLESITARAVASSLFTLGALAAWGVWQWRKLQGFKAEQKREDQLRQDPIKAYEERQEVELNQVMVSMKENLNKRNYLYALPWYLVLGLENAGKTSLINRSGQNFVFSSVMRASGQKSENPYSFDWWIGDESVLIDPDGELLTQGNHSNDNDGAMERRLWLHFVNWLERTRSRRPLNGIVLALDVSHLATATATERKAYANLLRARLRELMETLSTRLPVYIALTKLDLLHGFEPFFKHYSRSQREDVLGFTFSLDSIDDLDNWLNEFSKDYSQFVERINDVLPHAVSVPMDLEERNAIYSFTRQISGLKEILLQFFNDALASDQFSTSALVRGAYFTSVYQQGVPTNAFDDAASRRYGLDHAINKAQQAKNSTVYFTQKLFNNIIYPEAGLASDNFRVAKQKRRLIGLSVVAGSIATVLLVGTWHRYYLSNVKHSDAVLAKVNEYKNEFPSNLYLASQQDVLVPLNKIREATLEFGFFRDKPQYISDFGLYQGHTIGPMVEATYLNLLENRFLPLLMADVVVQLNQAKTDEEKLAVLRVYRMMVDKSGRYKDYVLDYFSKYWQQEFAGQRVIQEELLGHLDYAMLHTDLAGDRARGDRNAESVMKPYDQVVAKVQSDLGSMPNDQRVYRNLKLNAQTVLGPSINLRNLIGPVFDVVFEERVVNSSSLYIPQMLTKKGFEDYFMPQSESVSELALIDSWVLGQSKSAQFSEADKHDLRNKIRSLYVADYTNTWRAALNEISVKYFSDINDAVSVLENFTGNIEPMQRLLRTLESNTQMYASVPKDEAAQKELLKNPKYKVASQIDAPFAELNAMLKPVGDKPAYINEVLVAVEELQNYLKSIQEAPDVGMAALDATKARVKLVNADPIYTVKRIASGLPKPLDTMVSKLADESWYVVKQEAIKHLEVRWHDDVYKTFEEKLAGRYPFNESSNKDSSLSDFEAFFAPNGTLDNFYNNQLRMFVEENIAVNDDDNAQSIIRKDVLEQLKQAKKIQQAFFNRKGVLDVSFSVEPLRLSNNKRRSVLNVDGQYLAYSHGPRDSVELIWPNTLRDSAISKVTLVPTKNNMSPRSINIQGPWAFFRLLEQGDVVGASSTSVDFKFAVDGGEMIYRLNSEADINPFTERLFKSFKLSKTLY
ncbi:type VI secretion system membrane subunit TssM [Vibrio anguillarum]|uniref:type VI secretion system membrane subunit TssM n=1 Tax=Vibrio anguillarum TaxID=55601 RepID=UPI00097E2104|nr:type VI secretion system membrane subunit TssM [Vibrio anguillarum]MBF4284064.1 type VI secretion system membrane subunit TssM [Vibrio anguillarum]MBF4289771.1 type VI secretion system membrane subunit TssM [Vibrio anguillarum]MBF4341651.1 type VI secretion system membrane subunit TssM [Vibrio anguillarum]MBF4358782.1 type VI secretion system membrane subunit TssM [Vibrio anguillarum]MBF4380320.1 type VI secretion system membrane subunit TssM [Vibrio anguillarum]